MSDDKKNAWKTFAEEIEVSGQHLLAEVNRLISEGECAQADRQDRRRPIFLTIPLTAGASPAAY